MARSSKYVRKWLLAFLLAAMPMVYAMAQADAIYAGQTTELVVDSLPGYSYHWTFYCDSTVNFATTPGNCLNGEVEFVGGVQDGSSVNVRWNVPGTYFFRLFVTGANGCTNLKVGKVIVQEHLPTAELANHPDEICVNEPAFLTVTLTGEPLFGFTLQSRDEDGNTRLTKYENIDNSMNPYEIAVSPVKTTWYTVVEVTDKYGVQKDPSNSVKITVHPLPRSSRIYLKME